MNVTEQAILDIYNKYYWYNGLCFDKNIVHLLLVVGIILVVILATKSVKKIEIFKRPR
jgi:hypothetical protein